MFWDQNELNPASALLFFKKKSDQQYTDHVSLHFTIFYQTLRKFELGIFYYTS